MSCQFNPLAIIVDIESVQKCLFFNNVLGSTSETPDVWDWTVDEAKKPKTPTEKRPTWLDDCCTALSPTAELLVFTHKTNMVILTSKWDSQEESAAKTKYHITWSGDPCQEQNEVITSALCLPLAASQSSRTAHHAPDWTCIALGFSSGALRFYTETGSLLLSEVLHEGPVTSIKCQTFTPSRHVFAPELSDELHVTYRNVVCSIYGFVLINTLRACRNQLARVQANCGETFTAPPLTVQKWSCPEQDSMVDSCIGLPQYPTSFSHLVTASVCGGFNAGYRPTPPQSSLVIAVGSKPYVGFHYAIEGSNAPILTDVAKAVATKLKSALGQAVPGWLLGGRKPSPHQEKIKEKLTLEPAEPMVCRYSLSDIWRQGNSITVSPHRNLSAVTDSLGRVTLIDNSSGIGIRMWKGYRDAQCGWIVAEEEQQKNERKRTALFLVIYSPKKAIIEVWALQQGPRVATFTATKHGRLIYTSSNLLGMSSLNNKGSNRSIYQCVFVDEEGNLKEITVPFHLALSDKNSNRARDIHLLKKMKVCLREEGEIESGGVTSQCQELRTNEMRAQALDILCASRRISAQVLLDVVEGFIQALDNQEEETPDPASKILLQKCRQLQKLLIFYQFTLTCQQKPPDYYTVVADDSNNDIDKLSEFLHSTKEELQRLLLLVTNGTQRDTTRVTFQDRPEGLPAYLAGFNTSQTENTIQLSNSTAHSNLVYLSEVIYQGSLTNISAWEDAAAESTIDASVLMKLSLVYWLNRSNAPSISEIYSFTHLLKSICTIAGSRVADKSWWDDVRTQLQESNSPLAAITATLVCRAVALSFEVPMDMTESMETENETEDQLKSTDWEEITEDSCLWSVLLSQLEDISVVYSALRRRPGATSNTTMQCLEYEVPQLSLSTVLAKGKGCISELVAKWLVSSGINPMFLLDDENSQKTQETPRGRTLSVGVEEGVAMETDAGAEARALNQQEAAILDLVTKLRVHFPYSLNGSILVANMCWEYVIAWNREVDVLKNLQSALNCLSVIPNPHLKQGVCTMLWSMHLKVMFDTSIHLINKVGKVPKERLCRQDIGLSDVQVTDFFKMCSDFLDIFMESSVLSEETPKQTFPSESWWENNSVPHLHQLALDQATANYDILHLLSQCCRAFYFLANFNLKTQRPLNAFFDSVGQSALFSEVSNSHVQLPGHFVNTKLTETRTHFLLRVVSGAMSTVIEHNEKYNTKQAVDWMSQCLALAADWSIPADPLRRQQVCELYARGFDRIAEEIIPAVNEKSLLGSQLLVIVGRRMKLSLASSSDLKNRVTRLSPVLTRWINDLEEGTEEESKLDDIIQLASFARNLIGKDNEFHFLLASQLCDAVKSSHLGSLEYLIYSKMFSVDREDKSLDLLIREDGRYRLVKFKEEVETIISHKT